MMISPIKTTMPPAINIPGDSLSGSNTFDFRSGSETITCKTLEMTESINTFLKSDGVSFKLRSRISPIRIGLRYAVFDVAGAFVDMAVSLSAKGLI